jgi:hypothetical protein
MARSMSTSGVRNAYHRIRAILPPVNFINLHYLYFIGTCLVTSVIFWGSSTPARSITYTDSLYLVVSAMTEAGLNTVNLSQINVFQQWLLWMHVMVGSGVFVSASVLYIRKRAFEVRFKTVIQTQRAEQREHRRSHSEGRLPRFGSFSTARPQDFPDEPRDDSAFESRHSQPRDPGVGGETMSGSSATELRFIKEQASIQPKSVECAIEDEPAYAPEIDSTSGSQPHVTFSAPTRFTQTLGTQGQQVRRRHSLTPKENIQTVQSDEPNGITATSSSLARPVSAGQQSQNIISNAVVGRNSQFHGLSREERENLGGVEYRATKFLSYVVVLYIFLWQLLGCLGLGAYIAYNKADIARSNGINPW